MHATPAECRKATQLCFGGCMFSGALLAVDMQWSNRRGFHNTASYNNNAHCSVVTH